MSDAPTPNPDHVRVMISVSQSVNDSSISPEDAQKAMDIVDKGLTELWELRSKLSGLLDPPF